MYRICKQTWSYSLYDGYDWEWEGMWMVQMVVNVLDVMGVIGGEYGGDGIGWIVEGVIGVGIDCKSPTSFKTILSFI